jgi:hypothetical protein
VSPFRDDTARDKVAVPAFTENAQDQGLAEAFFMRLNCTMSPVMNSGATQQRPSRRVIMQVVAEDILQDICNAMLTIAA